MSYSKAWFTEEAQRERIAKAEQRVLKAAVRWLARESEPIANCNNCARLQRAVRSYLATIKPRSKRGAKGKA